MQEAMEYLDSHGMACKDRETFYKRVKAFGINYIDLNPNGKNRVLTFTKEELDRVLKNAGLI